MKRIAVFVDAGYFWVQLCTLVTGNYSSRGQVQLRYQELHDCMLAEIEKQFPGGDLLRIYWYDGPGITGKTPEHHAIEQLDDFKLRLGTRNHFGQQKGVDGLIIADLISLTQQRTITHALVVSGDSDVAPGVIAAQAMGLRVHLLSLGSAVATSPFLAAEVDFKRSWSSADVSRFATLAPAPQNMPTQMQIPLPVEGPRHFEPLSYLSAVPGASHAAQAGPHFTAETPLLVSIARAAHEQIKTGPNAPLLAELQPGVLTLPRQVDGELLAVGRAQLGRVLEDTEKRTLRREFRALIV